MKQNQVRHNNHLHESDAKWFAVYTNFKREKLVEKQLKAKGIDCYLPLLPQTRRYASKIRTVKLPLISGYVFVRINKRDYLPVLQTEHVLKFVRIAKDLIAIPEYEIDTIKRVVGEGSDIVLERNSFQKGDKVEIISGKLVGLEGILLESRGKKLVEIELASLDFAMRFQVDPSILRKIQSPEILQN